MIEQCKYTANYDISFLFTTSRNPNQSIIYQIVQINVTRFILPLLIEITPKVFQ